MARRGIQVNQGKLCCAICLDLLKNPVTIPCGHNYCMDCIRIHWDGEDQKHIHSCPQCRQTFVPRPALVKNTMLAELVEELKKTGLQAAPADHCYAGPADVSCDVCTGNKLKAIKSCLQCLVSYCEQHLQPHYNVAALKKHKLVNPSENLQENICTNHNEVMKIFCRTDQQCICYLCSMDEHRGHCIVSAATEKNERQKELKLCKEKIHQKIKDREEDMMVFLQRMDTINYSADEAVRHSETIFSELMLLIEKRSSDIKQQIRSQQETELNRTRELLQQVQQDLSDLERKDAELEELFHTEDLIQFLHMFPLFSDICESTLHQAPRIRLPPLVYFEDVVSAMLEMKDDLEHILSDRWQKCSQTITDEEMLLQSAEPETATHFLQFSNQLTLDSNSESDDQPSAFQVTWVRKPPPAGLKNPYFRRAGGQKVEDPGISAETADPTFTFLDPPIQRGPVRTIPPTFLQGRVMPPPQKPFLQQHQQPSPSNPGESSVDHRPPPPSRATRSRAFFSPNHPPAPPRHPGEPSVDYHHPPPIRRDLKSSILFTQPPSTLPPHHMMPYDDVN